MGNENNELKIGVKFTADTKDADAAKKALGDINAEVQKGGKAPAAGFLGTLKAMKAEFADAGGGVKGFLAVLFGSGATVAAWAAGLVTAFGIATKALSVFMQKQVEVAKLDAVLANQGKLTDDYREKLQALAGTMAKATATSGNDWLQALTTLNKFGADTSNIDQYAEAVKNLAGFLDGGIPEASFLFGKAMQGNHAMLGRYGITVDSSKSKTEQLQQIMQQAAERGGGVLESRAKTLAGMFDAFYGSTKKVFGGLGNLISQTGLVQAGLSVLTGGLNMLAAVLPKTVPPVDGLTNSLTALSPEAKRAAEAVADLSKADAGDIGGVAKQANDATAALGKEVDALRKLQGDLDQQGDEELKQKLAQIDLQEAKAPKTGVNKEAFEQQRRLARRANEERKLNREESTTALAGEVAQHDESAANAKREAFLAKVKPQLDALKDNADKLQRESGLQPGEDAAAKLAAVKKAEANSDTRLRQSQRVVDGHVLPGEDTAAREFELQKIQTQRAALEGLANAQEAYRKAVDQAGKAEMELTEKYNAAFKARQDVATREAANKTKRETFTVAGQAEDVNAREAKRKAELQAKIDQDEAQAKRFDALDKSEDGRVTQAQRAEARAAAKRLRDANAFLAVGLEDDPTKRAGMAAGLRNTNRDAAAGLALGGDQKFGKAVQDTGGQLAAALASGREITVKTFQQLLTAANQQNAQMARLLKDANDLASRTAAGRR